ncbi:MAG: adenylate/guanylate cyclase domain-containing protein [Pirellulaceae bacterium]
MADLIAQGTEPQHRWRHRLPEDQEIVLGRHGNLWAIPWDSHISAAHASLCWQQGRLAVSQLVETRNPIFFRGRKEKQFQISMGEHFVIGATTFSLADEKLLLSINEPLPATEKTFSAQDLQAIRYRNADQQIDVLSELPKIISSAENNDDLFGQLVNLLLQGIPRACGVALVAADPNQSSDITSSPESIQVMHWDSRSGSASDIRPSQRLIWQATQTQKSVAYIWAGKRDDNQPTLTASEDLDWAFCTPINSPACPGWAIYVEGNFEHQSSLEPETFHPQALRDEMKFTELIASSLGNSRHLEKLKRNQAVFGQFFPAVVLDALSSQDPEQYLAPQEIELAVLFCDVRGFSRSSELARDDLLGLLERVSQALGVMTQNILAEGGVVGDFHGDSAMGFWGWPSPQHDSSKRACLAALSIRQTFEQAARDTTHPLHDFHVGIGIASGTAVAGKLGSADQVKVTAFGPVVNLAARLETMTKTVGASILIDETTLAAVQQQPSHEVEMRFRPVAQVQPFGLQNALQTTELLPALADPGLPSDNDLATYEQARKQFQEGAWKEAQELLEKVSDQDPVKPFLLDYLKKHGPTAPPQWNGTIVMTSK